MPQHGQHSLQGTKSCPKSSGYLCCLRLMAVPDGRVYLWLGESIWWSASAATAWVAVEKRTQCSCSHFLIILIRETGPNTGNQLNKSLPQLRIPWSSFLPCVSRLCGHCKMKLHMVGQVLPGLTHSSSSTNLPLKQRRIRDKMLMGKENQGHWMAHNQFCRRGRLLPNFLIMYFYEMCLHVFDQLSQQPQPPSAVVLANSLGSHFPMPSLKFSKSKHLDEARKTCKWCSYCIYSNSLCFENHCTYNTLVSAPTHQ